MQTRDYCYLDKIRINDGIDKCRAAFLETYRTDKGEAVALINDPRLTFPSLYILLQEIEALQLESSLNSRNIIAIKIINHILKNRKSKEKITADKKTVYPILKWILETGHSDDGLDNEYDEIMDITVSLLINVYKDESILPAAADMIFNRNRKGRYIHDLVWAFFRSCSPNALRLIAGRFCSENQKDADLACELLNIETSRSNIDTESKQSLYQTYNKWLDENDRFLHFTGESFQFSSNPIVCKVGREKK